MDGAMEQRCENELSEIMVYDSASRFLMVSFDVGFLAWTLWPGARAML